jgi:hypothetical protein
MSTEEFPIPPSNDNVSEILSIIGVLGLVGYIVYQDYKKPHRPQIPYRREPVVVKERTIIRTPARDDDNQYFIDSRDHKLKWRGKKKPTVVEDLDDDL